MNFEILISYKNDENDNKTKDILAEDSQQMEKSQIPQEQIEKTQLSGIKTKKRGSNKWSLAQNQRYAHYLNLNRSLCDLTYEQKKAMKTNVKMSQHVKSRTPIQCHTHHQKMMKTYGSIPKIIQAFLRLEELIQLSSPFQQLAFDEFFTKNEYPQKIDAEKDEIPMWSHFLQSFMAFQPSYQEQFLY